MYLLCFSRIVTVNQVQSKNNLACDLTLNLGCQAFGSAIMTYSMGPTTRHVTPIAGHTLKTKNRCQANTQYCQRTFSLLANEKVSEEPAPR